MTDLQQALTEIVKNLEITATNLGAMETALIERGVLAADDIDSYTAIPQQNAKYALANARNWISRLTD